jgi:hypothetical protein
MKTRYFIILLTALMAIVSVAGCARPEIYGEHLSNRSVTPIKDILTHPEAYDGKTVTVKGQIAIECETGCWFNFKEGDAVIYVNLEPSGFAIPQKGGRNAIVEGNVIVEKGKPKLIGRGVEIR